MSDKHTVEWGGEEVSPETLNFTFEDDRWQGPWISLKPKGREREGLDPDEKEYFAVKSWEVLVEISKEYKTLIDGFPILKRLEGMLFDPADPLLDDYNDYMRDHYNPKIREIAQTHNLPRLDWKFNRLLSPES